MSYKGYKMSDEQKEKLSKALKGRKLTKHSEETKKKIRESNLGKKRSNEVKKNISESQKGKKLSKEHKLKLSIASRKNRSTWHYSDWKDVGNKSKYFDSFKCYIIKIYNNTEMFYKIGKTFQTIHRRFYNFKYSSYNYEVIKIIEGEARTISELEKELQRENKEYKYVPKIKFGGMYECFKQIKSLD